ncbi:MAG: GyrI-like domain-containing protein [Streptococcus orisratti]|uniref:GyrI-like domain-containing protein n=1 Tax=Streptococcus orisratti TaxID=114652 RepID=UPI002355C36C|nr:GyrI-like domain-containing protein [Streptococcus orisratti]MCI7678436.1 GyrI-like domain-containing protein [Streptococcus orisratti]
MAFDFKKEFKEFYQPKTKPSIITVPKMNYLAVRGTGDPNQEDSAYKESIELLYGVAYTLKMSHKTDYKIEGFFDYVVPPLEGFWWQEDREGVDYGHKEQFSFISVIRLPDFVIKDNVDWAISQASKKKKRDFSKVEFFTYNEGLCVQCMHVGPYNDEPKTVEAMHQFMEEEGYVLDITLERMHHEIYLGDVRKTAAEKLKTGLRHPIKKSV